MQHLLEVGDAVAVVAQFVYSSGAGGEAVEFADPRFLYFVVLEDLGRIVTAGRGFLAVDEVEGEASWVMEGEEIPRPPGASVSCSIFPALGRRAASSSA